MEVMTVEAEETEWWTVRTLTLQMKAPGYWQVHGWKKASYRHMRKNVRKALQRLAQRGQVTTKKEKNLIYYKLA